MFINLTNEGAPPSTAIDHGAPLHDARMHSAPKNLSDGRDWGRVWPIEVGGLPVGYIVLTVDYGLALRHEACPHGVKTQAQRTFHRHAPSVPQPAQPHAQALVEPLSPREIEVLRLVADGLKNQEIADKLFITRGTVRVHLNTIYGKLEVNNRVQAISRGRELGLLRDGSMWRS